MDKMSKEQRSRVMRANKSSDTGPELLLRKALWKAGLRYRVNVRTVWGTPDIAFLAPRVAVFVDGDFWHGFNFESRQVDFTSNRDYWVPKIRANMARDGAVTAELQSRGWVVLRFWEHEVKSDVCHVVRMIERCLEGRL